MQPTPETFRPAEDTIFRLRAKLDDNAYQILRDGDVLFLAFRIPGEEVDLLPSLEYLSEFLTPDEMEDVRGIVIISDRSYEVTSASMILPKLETKKEEDERLYSELKSALKKKLEPLVFTVENDILEMFRAAIRLDGSHNRTDESIGLDLLKVELPKEGEVVYLIFDDGYRKMSRPSFEKLVDNALTSLRAGPSLVKDAPSHPLSTSRSLVDRGEEATSPETHRPSVTAAETAPGGTTTKSPGVGPGDSALRNAKVIAREFSREMANMGYRKDSKFSRSDANQFFFTGLSGPAVLFKVMETEEELEPFLRILSHRKDAVGILVTREWDPGLEALSRIRDFVYLDFSRANRAVDVLRELLKGGGSI